MYKLLLYLHVASAIAFLLFHGATASVMFALKRERNPDRIQGLLELRDRSSGWWGIPMVVLLLSGIVMGIMGRRWGEFWMWASLGIFVVIMFVMSGFGRTYLDRAWHALDPTGHKPPMKKYDRAGTPASSDELLGFLRTGRPVFLSLIGVVGLALIVWLMMFQPI